MFFLYFFCLCFVNVYIESKETFHDLIDIVYTWVDDTDPVWQKELVTYAQQHNGAVPSNAVAKRRFKNHDELRYSLRSVYAFCPWVHHIFIVTFGQKPVWLKKSPMITIVDHKDIFTDHANLPTFNSMAIECNLHHIPYLQEHYIYFNDDVFVGDHTLPEDFFPSNDKIKVFLSIRKVPLGIPSVGEEGFLAASKNTALLLDGLFGTEQRYMHAHTPYPSLKSFVTNVEQRFSDIFAQVSSHHFRSLNDYTITNGLIPYAALYLDRGEIGHESWVTFDFGINPDRDHKMFKRLKKLRPKFFCVQDSADEDNPESISLLQCFLQSYFPVRAPWEDEED